VLGRFKDDAQERVAAARRQLCFASLSRPARDGVGATSVSRTGRETREVPMLRIHDVMLDAITTMLPMIRAIERHDRDLASQLRRAASSVALNIAEGSGSSGGMRTARYRTALGSARETTSCLLVAQRFGYVDAMPGALVAAMNHVIGTLVRVAV
jgi:four helix bundle protein